MALAWLSGELILGLAAIPILLYVLLTWNYNYWKKRGVPHVKPKFFFGNFKEVFMVRKTVGDLMKDLYWKNDGNSYAGVYRFLSPTLLVRDPELLKRVLVKDFTCFNVNAFRVTEELDPLLSRNPFFSHGNKWEKVRALLSPSFTNSKLKPLLSLMKGVAQEMVDYLQNIAPSSAPDGIEAKDLASKYTTDVVATCAFGITGGSFKDPNAEMLKMGRSILNTDLIRNIEFLIVTIFPSLARYLRIRLMPVSTANFYRRIVQEVIEYREKNNITRNDYLQYLLSLKTSHGNKKHSDGHISSGKDEGITDVDVTGHAVTFLIEGFETSSITLSFLLYELAMNPDIQERLREELLASLQYNDGNLNLDTVITLPYLNMVLQETLRMHPPVIVLEKVCTRPYPLETPSGGTFTLEPGTVVFIPVKALHDDPKFFPEPDMFDPERFSDERKDSINRFAYLPFGEGPRICIGMRFAQAQIKIGAAMILLNYNIQRTPKTPAKVIQDPNYFMAAAKGGLWLNFVRRT